MYGFDSRIGKCLLSSGAVLFAMLVTLNASAAGDDDGPPEVKIFSLENADAAKLATMLDVLSEPIGVRVSADERTNALVAVGSAAELAMLEAIILRLDEEPTDLEPVKLPPEPETASFFEKMLKEGDWVLAINHTGQDRYVLRVLTPEEVDDESEQLNLRAHNDAYTVSTIGGDFIVLQNHRRDLMLPQSSVREIYRKNTKVDTARFEEAK